VRGWFSSRTPAALRLNENNDSHMKSYLQTVEDVYAQAAHAPDASLCCTQAPVWRLPDLHIPPIMFEMNYGCGSTVNPRDLRADDPILYVGVGGGLEALQFAYFTRRPDGVIAVDPVAAMRAKAQANFVEAAKINSWFRPDFVRLLNGNALRLPVESNSITVAAQNCLFNVFLRDDLDRALSEMIRVLKSGGFFATSDPITPKPLPDAFRADAVARARCLSGCLTFDEYIAAIVNAGFGRVDVRARFPYRLVTPSEYSSLTDAVLLESVEIVAYKVPDGFDGAAINTGRMAIFAGPEATFTDASGVVLPRGIPVAVSDAAAARMKREGRVVVTASTYHALGGGCC
jgi:SAM-dependent methyltransferase